MGFAQRLELVDAMGLLQQDLLAPVAAINKLRNRIAHQLDFEISSKEVRDLRNVTPKGLREAVRAKPRQVVGLADLLTVIVLMVEIQRQRHAFARLMNEQGALSLRVTLAKVKGRY